MTLNVTDTAPLGKALTRDSVVSWNGQGAHEDYGVRQIHQQQMVGHVLEILKELRTNVSNHNSHALGTQSNNNSKWDKLYRIASLRLPAVLHGPSSWMRVAFWIELLPFTECDSNFQCHSP